MATEAIARRGSRVQSSDNLKVNQGDRSDAEDLWKRANKILQYWFLMEKEVATAIAKGNFDLLDVAKARVDYLLKVVKPELIEEGLKGEEEALKNIQIYLYNSGWWGKANNLNIRELGYLKERPNSEVEREEEAIKIIYITKQEICPSKYH